MFKDRVKKTMTLLSPFFSSRPLLTAVEPSSVLFLKDINLGKTTEICTHG